LLGAPQHNGKTGTVVSYDVGKGRYAVVLDEGLRSERRLAVRPANLKLYPSGYGSLAQEEEQEVEMGHM
jgi:hypothetical protein